MALCELLVLHPHRVVATIAGLASSGAAIVAMGADLRCIAPGARIMLHQARASVVDVTADELRPIVDDLDTVDRLAAAIFSQANGRTPECVAAWEQASMTFDAREAIAAGLAHEPIGSRGA